MKIAVFGSGYVGLITGVCLSDKGNDVTCIDIDRSKIDDLNQGKISIYEKGLEELLLRNLNKNLFFTVDAEQAIKTADIIFICVGTPSNDDGSANLNALLALSKTIGEFVDDHKIVIIKSTVPVGTHQKVKQIIDNEIDKRKINLQIDLISNPEFLKEGSSVHDFYCGDRIIIGGTNEAAMKKVENMYRNASKVENYILMDNTAAELVKYASNVFLANKISFINLISQFAEKLETDIDDVKKGLVSDKRIGDQFFNAGIGFGGSCFPKDVDALIDQGETLGIDVGLIKSIREINDKQRSNFIEKIEKLYHNNFQNRIFTIWGLAFKPETDDIREAPSLNVVSFLIDHGALIQAYDPIAQDNFFKQLTPSEQKHIEFFQDKEAALSGAHALIILTENAEFVIEDYSLLQNKLMDQRVFDARNILDQEQCIKHKINYIAIGKPPVMITQN